MKFIPLLLLLLTASAHAQDIVVDCADDARNAVIAIDTLNFGQSDQDSHSVIEMKDKDHWAKFEVTVFSTTSSRTYDVKLKKVVSGMSVDTGGFNYKCIVEKLQRTKVID